MTFVTTVALAAALLVVIPYLAHRLRRRRAEEQPFAPARLVAPAPPTARRRSRLEDRMLFAVRAAALALLAVLGATPLVRCSRLSLQRPGGASVAMAIVLDDSMSMRAPWDRSRSRFARARQGARELLASARDGDAVAIVLAGAPPRIALAATTDLRETRKALDAVFESDRATDLEGAVDLAREVLAPLPQLDHRIVVLSDLADGLPNAAPLGDSSSVPVWIALPELAAQGFDCAVMRADRSGMRVRIQVACGPGASASGRDVVLENPKGEVVGRASLGPGQSSEVTVLLPSDEANPAQARLSGSDAIVGDDVAPVISEAGRGAIEVVIDSANESVVTGGAPIVEQALSALELGVDVRPIPSLSDRAEDLVNVIGILVDDPPGFTPEQRHVLSAYLGGGGVLLVALGPHAAAAPLGASLEPVLEHPISWGETTAPGADPASAVGELAESAASLLDLQAFRRARLSPEDVKMIELPLRWADGAPLVGRRAVGRGEAWIVTLPFSVEASDLALRPAFLALLQTWARAARERSVPKRSNVGSAWTFPGSRSVQAQGPSGPVTTRGNGGDWRVVPSLLGVYRVTVDGKPEERVAAPEARELDLRPRTASSKTDGAGVGERSGSVEVSGQVAFILLALLALEVLIRLRVARKSRLAMPMPYEA